MLVPQHVKIYHGKVTLSIFIFAEAVQMKIKHVSAGSYHVFAVT